MDEELADEELARRFKVIGSVAGVSACLAVAADAKGERQGGALKAAILEVLEDVDLPESANATLEGFCWEIERFISGWVTGKDPLSDREEPPFGDLPLGDRHEH